MHTEEWHQYLSSGEGEKLEFKASFGDEVIETLSAFANSKGGTVLIGVNDDSSISGVNLKKETIQRWVNEIKGKTLPGIVPIVDETEFEGKSIVAFKVQEFPVKPVAFRGRYFQRVGNANHRLSVLEITQLTMQSLQVSWDSYPSPTKSWDNLDTESIQRFIKDVNSRNRFRLEENSYDALKKLRLVSKKQVTNAAWLLFGEGDTGFAIHVGRLKSPSVILDDKLLRGNLFSLVNQSMSYILNQIKVASEVTGTSTSRNEIFEYPLPAIREVLLNAVVHRDYMSPSDIQIKIFDNKITFFSPGQLVGNLTVEDLLRNDYQAHARNKLIAEAFYLKGDIEKYGSGLIRVRQEIESYPTMKFKMEQISNGILATLEYSRQKISSSKHSPDDVTEIVTENVTENVTDETSQKRHRRILEIMTANPRVTTSDLARKLDVSKRTVLRDIARLKSEGRISFMGPAKKGYWQIIISG